jgi:hypothetical protein
MLGGPPGWPAPIYSQPVLVSPPAQWQPWPAPPQASRPPQRPPGNPSTPALAQQKPLREPLARAQMEDPAPVPVAPRPTALCLPAPEQLGVMAAQSTPSVPAAPVDWNATHAQLNRFGAVSVQLVRLPAGGYRFTFLLPTADPQRTRHVEATGATEAEAVNAALASVTALR